MRRTWILLALFGIACGHAHEAEVVSTYEPRATLAQTFTADTTRLQNGAATTDAAGVRALAAFLDEHLAAVGTLRPDKAAGDHIDLVVDLPAPGWALRARIVPKAEQLCLVILEPLATQPNEHPVEAAPWSVHDAFATVLRHAPSLLPSKLPPMEPARFARLREEAAAAAAAGTDRLLSKSEYVRVPRPITSEGSDRPYFVPPAEPSTVMPAPQRE
jgi:hypothetical protein